MTTSVIRGSIDDRVQFWADQGFRVTSQTARTAQLVKPRRLNPLEFIVMPLYLIEYLGQREQAVYLQVRPDGAVSETRQNMDLSLYRRLQAQPAPMRIANAAIVLGVILVVLYLVRGA